MNKILYSLMYVKCIDKHLILYYYYVGSKTKIIMCLTVVLSIKPLNKCNK